jgi:hypothetical protein
MEMKNPLLSGRTSCAIFLLGFTNLTLAQNVQPGLEEMWELIQQQQAQIEALQQELGQQEEQIEENTLIATTAIDAAETFSDRGDSNQWYDRVSLGGYAEHHYNMVDEGSDTIDAHRYVLFIGNKFSDELRFFSEFELEHSLAGDGKPGEVELEQAFIEWQYSNNHRLTMGQYLLPVGILNETHEPDTFYGVERNLVESEVVPSTWWETGIMFSGEITPGLTYDAAMHSGLQVENFRIRSGRQKSALATADNLAYTGRLRYTGVPGLDLAVSVQLQTDIAQSTLAEEASATLTQAHLIYQKNDFSLRALYASWDIDNAEFEANGSDQPSGWFIEPSYKLSDKLGIFARYSEVDPARGDRPTQLTERVDYGVNYWLHPRVAIKADYQDSLEDGSDAVNLGIGWSF